MCVFFRVAQHAVLLLPFVIQNVFFLSCLFSLNLLHGNDDSDEIRTEIG